MDDGNFFSRPKFFVKKAKQPNVEASKETASNLRSSPEKAKPETCEPNVAEPIAIKTNESPIKKNELHKEVDSNGNNVQNNIRKDIIEVVEEEVSEVSRRKRDSYEEFDPVLRSVLNENHRKFIKPCEKHKITIHVNDKCSAAWTYQNRPISFIVYNIDNFEKIFDYFSKIKRVLPKQIILCYKGVMVTKYGTPDSVGIVDGSEIDAFTKETYEDYLVEKCKRLDEVSMVAQQEPIENQEKLMEMAESLHQRLKETNEEVSGENNEIVDPNSMKLKIINKSKNVEVVTISKDATIQDVIHKYFEQQKQNLDGAADVHLIFDGETLKKTDLVADILEDEDMLEIHF